MLTNPSVPCSIKLRPEKSGVAKSMPFLRPHSGDLSLQTGGYFMKYVYVSLIQKGKLTLSQVPPMWQAEVAAILGEEETK